MAHLDPNSRVSGKGVAALESQGIRVEVGLMESEARRINAHFIHFHTMHSPYTTIKAAMSLDGKTATSAGNSQWITGPKARAHVHKLRAQSGAVMAGIGTVLADDPLLTARLPKEIPRQALRIIVDSRLRTPPNCRAVQASSVKTPLLIVTTDCVTSHAAAAIEHEGVEVLRLPTTSEHVDLKAMMAELTRREIISVLVEGGGELNAALLQAGVVHSVLFFVAPLLIGGRDGPTAIEGEGDSTQHISDAIPLREVKVRRFGPDFAFEGLVDTPSSPSPSSERAVGTG